MKKYSWLLRDLKKAKSNGVKVFSTFACGGGSSMGYKLAGCDVVAACDIDPQMKKHYIANLHPDKYFLMPVSKLLDEDLSAYGGIDILDGSPPCSTFSMAGNREKDWSKEKHFREGQAKQVLSDLFFDFLDVAEKLRPKVVIAENVKGMLHGNAKGYCKLIFARLREIGYRPQLFLINSADCGVPQKRQRVFFCALRTDINMPDLVVAPKHKWISAGDATLDIQNLTAAEIADTQIAEVGRKRYFLTPKGHSMQNADRILTGRNGWFNKVRAHDKHPAPTLCGVSTGMYHWNEPRWLTYREWKRLGSFPDDYWAETDRIGKYMIGMSVPPKMMEVVARAVCSQWLGVEY